MTKIKIGYNTEAEKQHRKDLERKINACNELLEVIQQYISVDDKNTFLSNIHYNFKEAFLNKYASDFPPLVSYDTMLKLSDVPIGKIYQLADEYNAIDIDCFDAETGKAKDIDFTIYANDNAEAERFELSKELSIVINKLRESGTHIYIGQVCQSLNNSIHFDFLTNQFQPNINFIQQTRI